jgi:hypothetical protein
MNLSGFNIQKKAALAAFFFICIQNLIQAFGIENYSSLCLVNERFLLQQNKGGVV